MEELVAVVESNSDRRSFRWNVWGWANTEEELAAELRCWNRRNSSSKAPESEATAEPAKKKAIFEGNLTTKVKGFENQLRLILPCFCRGNPASILPRSWEKWEVNFINGLTSPHEAEVSTSPFSPAIFQYFQLTRDTHNFIKWPTSFSYLAFLISFSLWYKGNWTKYIETSLFGRIHTKTYCSVFDTQYRQRRRRITFILLWRIRTKVLSTKSTIFVLSFFNLPGLLFNPLIVK